jgi:DNA-binding IclR family transcriptional regulator
MRAVTVVTQVGSILPLLGSSTGLVFSAFMPATETRALRSLELMASDERAMAIEKVYDHTCKQIRERGLHVVHGLLMSGINAVSAPVFNAHGHLVAVMTVVGSASVFAAEEDGPAAKQLLAATQAVSWRMGYQPSCHKPHVPEQGQG